MVKTKIYFTDDSFVFTVEAVIFENDGIHYIPLNNSEYIWVDCNRLQKIESVYEA